MNGSAVGEKTRAGRTLRNVIVLLAVLSGSTSLAPASMRRTFEVGARVGMVRLDDPGVVEEELVAAGVAELAFAKNVADLRRGAVHVIGVDLHDDRDLVRSVAFEDHMLHHQLYRRRFQRLF